MVTVEKQNPFHSQSVVVLDGTHLAFTSHRDGEGELYTIKPDGTELTNLTHSPGVNDGWVALVYPDDFGGDIDQRRKALRSWRSLR